MSWAGSARPRCAPIWPSTPSRWASGRGSAPARTSATWCTTATAEFNTSPSATPSASPRPAPWLPSARGGGDSYDNALAEAFNSLFKAELVRNKGPWKDVDELEIAIAEYIDWFNHRRLHGEIGLIPTAEHEDNYYRHNPAATTVTASVASLH